MISLLQSIYDAAVRPVINRVHPKHDPGKFIVEIQYEINDAAGIIVDVFCADENEDSAATMDQTLIILHLQFRTWLFDNGFLYWESNTSNERGEHEQRNKKLDYMEWLELGQLTDNIIYQYMKEKKLTTLDYKP